MGHGFTENEPNLLPFQFKMKYLPIIFLLLCGCEPRLAQHFKEPKILTDSKGTNYVVEHCGGHECSVRVITP